MNTTRQLFIASALVASVFSAFAASHAGAPMTMPMPMDMPMKMTMPDTKNAAGAESTVMTDGEIRKVDLDNKKITIKHGAIATLDMPAMTMVYRVKDAAMLDTVKAGDKVRFHVEKEGSAMVVTDIQAAK
jgi:Cu(I)/Ag(I) efflux system protein CusF